MDSFNAYYQNVQNVSPVVLQHLPSIEWLVSTSDADRRTGRTTALALAFLRDSFTSPAMTKVFDHNPNASRRGSEVVSKLRGMDPDIHIEEDGMIENQPAYAATRASPQFRDTLRKVRQDFVDVVRAGVILGVDPTWMMEQLREALAESVMDT